MTVLLEIRDYRLAFDTFDGTAQVLDGIDLTLAAGETLGIVGETGCGKSVLARSLLALNPMPPARVVSGNPSTRKRYDNGYLLVDDALRVYHMKQVRGRPFVRRTDVADSLQIGQIFVTEFADRKSLGFLVDSKKRFYTLGAEDYKLHEIPVGKFGPTRENMMIIGDMFYWTVTIQGAESKRYVAVNARDYSLADEYRPEEKPQAWAEYAKYLFPFELSFTSPLDGYVKPRIAEVSFQALWLGLVLGAFYALIRRRSPGGRLWQTVGVVLFGLFLFVPLLVFGTANR